MTLTRFVIVESIRVFTACNTAYWGFCCWPLSVGESQGGDKHWSWQRPYRIRPDDWGVSVKKKKKECSKQRDASFHYKESHCANYNKVCHNPSNNIAFWTGYNCVRRKSIYTTGNKRSYANFYHQQLSKHQQKVTDLSRGENNFYTLVSQKKPQSYWRLVAS